MKTDLKLKEMKEDELVEVAGGEGEYLYSFKRNDRVNSTKAGTYYIIEENVETNDSSQMVKVTEHTRGENASVYFGSYSHLTAGKLASLYKSYGGIIE